MIILQKYCSLKIILVIYIYNFKCVFLEKIWLIDMVKNLNKFNIAFNELHTIKIVNANLTKHLSRLKQN